MDLEPTEISDHHLDEARQRSPRQRDPYDGGGVGLRVVLTQLAAVHKALSRAGYAIVATGLQQCLAESDAGLDSVDVKKMEKLFLALA